MAAAEKRGTKVSQAEATQNPADLLKLTNDMAVESATPEVEGQAPYAAYVWCPGCGTKYRTILSTRVYKYYTCPRCGTYFKA